MAVPRLARIKIPGLGKLNGALENWANWIEYAVAVRAAWPLSVSRTPTGNLVKLDVEAFIPRVMYVTTTIPAATGTGTTLTLGTTGRAREAKWDVSTSQWVDDSTSKNELVLNFHNKTFQSGCFIKAQRVKGNPELHAFDINDCTKFT